MRARVRYQQVDSAKFSGGLFDEALDISFPSDICDDPAGFYALSLDFLNNLVQVMRVAGTDSHRAALTR